MSSRRHAQYGRGQVVLTSIPPSLSPSDLKARLLDTFRSPHYQPPKLPRVGLELMELSRQPDVDIGRVLRLVEQDPLIAGEVLRIAQSPAYAGKVQVQSLQQALMRLGLETLTHLVLQASMSLQVFRAPSYERPMEEIRRHSIATAHIARIVCRQTSLPDDFAFLCGLLHDVGIVASLIVLAHRRKQPPPFETVWPAVHASHDEAGAVLARVWRLPMDVAFVLQLHHELMHQGRIHPMAAAVCVADRLAVQLGFHYGDDDMTQYARAAKALGLTPAVLKLVRRQAEPVVQDIE